MPDTPLDPAAVRVARAWVAAALAVEGANELRREPVPDAASAPDLIEAVRRHRIAEVLAPHTDTLGIPAEVAAAIARFRAAGRRALTVQILEIGRVQRLLTQQGIDVLTLKGPALAVLTAGDPAARGPGDIDLMVAPWAVERAREVLLANGWSPRAGSEFAPGTWAWRHAVRSDNAFTYDGPGSSIDLHWRLDPTLDALPAFEEVWARRQQVDLGHGVLVASLGPADAFAHTCLHTAKDSWRWLRSLVDVHRLAARPDTWDRDWQQQPLRRLEARTLAVTAHAVGLPEGVPDEVLARVDQVPSSALRRALAAQERPAREAYPFPGAETVRRLRYLTLASTSPRDLAYSVVALTLPVQTVVGVEARSGRTGVPLVLWRRLRRLGRRLVAWQRREPGAGVSGPLTRK